MLGNILMVINLVFININTFNFYSYNYENIKTKVLIIDI